MSKKLFLGLAVVFIIAALFVACEPMEGTLEHMREKASEENSGGINGPLPALTGTVSINGIARAGETLNAVTASLEGNGTISYQWSRGDNATDEGIYITGATESSYQLIPADIGKYIRLTVTRSDNTGSVSSIAIGPIEAAIIVINIPAIQGIIIPAAGGTPVATITEGAQYTGTVSWTPDHAVFTSGTQYTAIVTLTAKSGYTLQGVAADFFTVAGATTTNPASTGTVTAIFPVTNTPLTGEVSISGTARAGETLTAVTTSLEGSGTISYQWKRGDSASVVETIIGGATGNTYDLVPADALKYITVTVSRANNTGSKTSTAIGPVQEALVTISIPGIPGVTAPVAGATPMTSITPTAQYTGTVEWTPSHSTFVAGTAYSATVTLSPQTGYTLQGVSKDFFTVAGASSVSNPANSGVVSVAFSAINTPLGGTVSITGGATPTVGTALTVNTSGLSGQSGTLYFEWSRSTSSSGTFAPISEAIGSSYTPVVADYNNYIKVTVTSSGNSGSLSATTSAATVYAALGGSISITGGATPTVGTALTVNTSSLSGQSGTLSYGWSRSTSSSGSFTNIAGTDSASYTPVTGDSGYYLRITVTSSQNTGSQTATTTAATITPTIAVTGISGIPSAVTFGDLTLNGLINPPNATYQNIVWSVGSTGNTAGATVTTAGSTTTLNTTKTGQATILATITNGRGSGSDYTEYFTITFSEPSMSGIWVSGTTNRITFYNSSTGYVYLLEDYSGGFRNYQKGIAVFNETESKFTLKGTHNWLTTSGGSWTAAATSNTIPYTKSGANWSANAGAPLLAGLTFTPNGSYSPITGITVPTSGWGGTNIDLPTTGNPSSATYRNIVWSFVSQSVTTLGAYIQGVVTPPVYVVTNSNSTGGTVTISAKILNGGPKPGDDYQENFTIAINAPTWYVGSWTDGASIITFSAGSFLLKTTTGVNAAQGNYTVDNNNRRISLTNIQPWTGTAWGPALSGTYAITYSASTPIGPVGSTFTPTGISPSQAVLNGLLNKTFSKQ